VGYLIVIDFIANFKRYLPYFSPITDAAHLRIKLQTCGIFSAGTVFNHQYSDRARHRQASVRQVLAACPCSLNQSRPQQAVIIQGLLPLVMNQFKAGSALVNVLQYVIHGRSRTSQAMI